MRSVNWSLFVITLLTLTLIGCVNPDVDDEGGIGDARDTRVDPEPDTTPDEETDVADTDETEQSRACGGATGQTCGENAYCALADGECSKAEVQGTCSEKPERCQEIYAPVCGCDGETYDNDCKAAAAGVNVAREGECDGNGDGEFCDGQDVETTGNCEQFFGWAYNGESCKSKGGCECNGDDCDNLFETEEACLEKVESECDESPNNDNGNTCGGDTCGDGEYCSQPFGRCSVETNAPAPCRGVECSDDRKCYRGKCVAQCQKDADCEKDNNVCGSEDFCHRPPNQCRESPERCTEQFDPVCGCDDETYGNACKAASAGVNVAFKGKCEGEPREGLCDGQDATPKGQCEMIIGVRYDGESCDSISGCSCEGEDCGSLFPTKEDCQRTVEKASCNGNDGNGGSEDKCGGITGEMCDSGEVCIYPKGTCDAADMQGTCKPESGPCATVMDPVCGCDGKTYNNSCRAHRNGVSVDHEGECEGE